MYGLFRYKVVVYYHGTEDEQTYYGIVTGENYGDAMNAVFQDYEYHDETNDEHDADICEITLSAMVNMNNGLEKVYEFGGEGEQ